MFTKTLIAAAAAVAVSGAAFAGPVYQGGPKSSIPMASQTIEIKKPYAQYVPGTAVNTNRHYYRGGPQTGVPHGR